MVAGFWKLKLVKSSQSWNWWLDLIQYNPEFSSRSPEPIQGPTWNLPDDLAKGPLWSAFKKRKPWVREQRKREEEKREREEEERTQEKSRWIWDFRMKICFFKNVNP